MANQIVQLWSLAKVGATLWVVFYPLIIPDILKAYLVNNFKEKVHLRWSRRICRFFRIRMHQLGSVPRANGRRTIYLFNHKTMADIFIHDAIAEGSASFLSRYLVGVLFWTALLFYESVWMFRRGNSHLPSFFEWMDYKFDASPRPHLLIYPEGHRMQLSTEPAPLKHGALKYAYSRGLRVQICISFGNQKVMSESPPSVNRSGTDVFYSWDEPILPQDYSSVCQFIVAVEKRFHAKYKATYEIYAGSNARL